MNVGRSRRRLRVRRKRKGESLSLDLAAEAGTEVVARMGCCLLEAVVTATAVAGLLTVPAYILLTRVT